MNIVHVGLDSAALEQFFFFLSCTSLYACPVLFGLIVVISLSLSVSLPVSLSLCNILM